MKTLFDRRGKDDMVDFPRVISQFLTNQHILTLCVHSPTDLWAANCFYVFDPVRIVFYVLSNLQTRHAEIMSQFPHVVGTVSTDTIVVEDIQGVQYEAVARQLIGATATAGYQQYYQRFPFAKMRPAPIWQLMLAKVKFTDNTQGFGTKIIWEKDI